MSRSFFALSVGIVIVLLVYYIDEIYIKWSNQPIIMSVSPTPLQITDIPFAAFTICNVNQAQKHKVDTIKQNSKQHYYLKSVCEMAPVGASLNYSGVWTEYRSFIMEVWMNSFNRYFFKSIKIFLSLNPNSDRRNLWTNAHNMLIWSRICEMQSIVCVRTHRCWTLLYI